MFIKTVSTTSGINPIKFDETGGVFYWILNTGLSTVYASTKSAFTAGDDGVVSLGPKESRRLETNNDTIYILGEGQVEIHNQRDGICSFKQAPTSSGSGGGGTVDAYSKTESDAKYAQKTDIPSSLPANGGNADTVNDYHVSESIHSSTSKPPKYFTDVARIDHTNKTIESWDTSNIKVALADRATNAENADMVDGKHPSDFYQIANGLRTLAGYNDIFSATLSSSHACWNKWCHAIGNSIDTSRPDYIINAPESFDTLWYEVFTGGESTRAFQIAIGCFTHQRKNFIRYMHDNVWSVWKEISTTPIKSTTLSGTTDANGNLMLWAASENKIPICAILTVYFSSIFYYTPNGNYYLGVTDINTWAHSPNVPISGTVYYIEQG